MRFIKKRKTQYSLEIANETAVKTKVKTSKSRSSFSPAKKLMTAILAITVLAPAIIAGTAAIPDPNKKDAQAADFFTNMICGTPDQLDAIYGGQTANELTSSPTQNAIGRTQKNINSDTGESPWGGAPMPVAGAPDQIAKLLPKNKTTSLTTDITMLERYGYFAPTFSSWSPTAAMKEGENDNPFDGTPVFGSGGSSSLTEVGPGIIVKNPTSSPMFANGLGDCVGGFNAGIGNFIMFAPKLAIGIASTLYVTTTDLSLTGDSILAPIGDVIETLILGDGKNKGLKDLLFLDFMLIVIMLGALIIAWQAFAKGQTTQAVQSVGWMLLVAISGILLLSNPLFISTTMEKGMQTIETAIEKATLQTSNLAPECSLPDSADKSTARKVTCSLWLNSIYKPWVQGQFGKSYNVMLKEGDDPSVSDNTEAIPADKREAAADYFKGLEDSGSRTKDLRASIEGSTLASEGGRGVFTKMIAEKPLGTKNMDDPAFKNWAFYQVHAQSNWDKPTGVNYSEIAINQLAIKSNENWKSASDGIFNALLSMLASAAPAAFLIIISGSLISFQLILIILLVMAPFFFTIGFFPGWGRRILARWAELLTSLFVKRVILALFLFIFLKIYISILAMDISWVYQVLFVTILTFVALTQKNVITDMVTSQINFGSGSNFGDEEQMKRSAAGAILGGYAGAKAAGAGLSRLGRRPGRGTKGGKGDGTENNSNENSTVVPPVTPKTPRTPTSETEAKGAGAVAPFVPTPNESETNNGPEGWKWDREDRDENGNLLFASRYNEDGTGKAYANGETYHLSRDENGNVYGINDKTGEKLSPEDLKGISGKRERNSNFAEIENGQREIESMDRSSEKYKEAREEAAQKRAEAREAAAEVREKTQAEISGKTRGQAAIESGSTPIGENGARGNNGSSTGPNAPTTASNSSSVTNPSTLKSTNGNDVVVFHGPRDGNKPPAPPQNRVQDDVAIIELRYDPETDTYSGYDEYDSQES